MTSKDLGAESPKCNWLAIISAIIVAVLACILLMSKFAQFGEDIARFVKFGG